MPDEITCPKPDCPESPVLAEKPSFVKKNDVASHRLQSIDALRGFDMFMITGGTDLIVTLFTLFSPVIAGFLNTQFSHVAWHGFVFYDLIFPLFIFISGISIPFSVTKRVERGESKKGLYMHVAIRTTMLFVLGLLHNGFDLDPFAMRFAGVLQRIAIASCAAAIIAMNTNPRTQLYIVGAILAGYWLAMALIPVPGAGAGDFTQYGNLAGYIDRLLLPYPGKWCCYGFGDSEGILTTIPAVATALLGVQAGHLLRSNATAMVKIMRLIIAGTTCLTIGIAWHFVFPINKYLWTSSFVLFAGGWSMLLLVLFYWIIDVRRVVKWAFFFRVIGSNSILIYMLGGAIGFGFLEDIFGSTTLLAFLVAALDVTGKWIVLYLLYRKKWFLKF
jgi:predicted acyltransferase